MKFVPGFLILASFSTLVLAADQYHCHANQICHSNEVEIKLGVDAIVNQNGMVGVECNDPKAPAQCRDLFKAACEAKKTTNKIGQLRDVISARTYQKLPKGAVKTQVNEAAEAAIKMADELVHKQGRVARKDVVDTFMDVKSILYQAITSNNSLNGAKKGDLYKKIQASNLRTGYEYVEDLIRYGMAQNMQAEPADIRRQALSMYISACGPSGLDVNAFNHEGNIVLCPGVIYSLEDYDSRGKQDILNALSFTIGHELAHSIDYTDQPEVYTKLKGCYETITNNPEVFKGGIGDEIVGDYWGTLVLGQRLKNQKTKTEDSVRTVGMSIDGFCAPPAEDIKVRPPVHPNAQFRVNVTIAQAPIMRELLGCETPSKDNPACWLDGMLTRAVNGR